MELKNIDNLDIVSSFLRLYSDTVKEIGSFYKKDIRFFLLKDEENIYRDSILSFNGDVYISPVEIGRLGLSIPEIYAAIAHEIGHIVYRTHPWRHDSEQIADSFAADLGLRNQMISVIDRLISSKRHRNLVAEHVRRIQFLQNVS